MANFGASNEWRWDTANTVAAQRFSGIIHKDSSTQVEGLIRNLENRLACDVYRDRLRKAEHAAPYAGATQSAIVRTYEAAAKAGCIKQT
jgi:hypothetical protein